MAQSFQDFDDDFTVTMTIVLSENPPGCQPQFLSDGGKLLQISLVMATEISRGEEFEMNLVESADKA